MLKKIYAASLGLALATAAQVALADRPGSDWISVGQVETILKQAGYTQVTKIEADDGHWEGEGIKDGKTYEWRVDPHSGKITKSEPD